MAKSPDILTPIHFRHPTPDNPENTADPSKTIIAPTTTPPEPPKKRRLRKIIIISAIALIILLPTALILLPNLLIGRLIIVPDLKTINHLVMNPFASGDQITLNTGDTFSFTVETDTFAPILLKSCSYDTAILQLSGNTVTALAPGTTTLSCAPIFRPDQTSSQLSVTVQ